MQPEDLSHELENRTFDRRRALKVGGGAVGLGALSALLAACGDDSSSSADTGAAAPSTQGGGAASAIMGNGEEYLHATYLSTLSIFVAARRGMDDVGKLLNVTFKHVGTPLPDGPAEVQVIQQALTDKTAGLLVAVAEDKVLTPLINQQIDKGVPVVTIDGAAPSSRQLAFVGTSNVNAGRECGMELIRVMGGEGNVILTRATTVSAFAEREQGFREAVATTDGAVRIVAVVNDYDQSDRSAQSVGQAIQAHPDIQGVMTLSAGAGVGTLRALQQAGKDDVKVGVFSNDKVAYQETKTNENLFVIAQDEYKMGFFGGLLLHIAHQNVVTPNYDAEAAGVSPLPPNVDTGIIIINADNADDFIPGAS